ncbi:amino acid synthesis family protein [uncultured Methylovirgula sp.]|uniref:amino acid synthesis family protein n=1 Tax=uncultured Methylovirgula sp. TaxID=1285960 RepID=UPI00261F8D2F|nr:amino acid synthesis family protein [uncultured Methylovirgula sp.]
MDIQIRKVATIVEDHFYEAGRRADKPLRKVASVMVLKNPYAGRYVEDLSELTEASIGLGKKMGAQALAALGGIPVEAYGKAGIVGLNGETEHANALLTTVFANPIRDAIGGGDAWISSVTKIAGPGALVDVPMNSIDDVYIRSHYGTMSLALPDAPLPDEIALIFCFATGGRLNARVGGLTIEDVRKQRAAVKAPA